MKKENTQQSGIRASLGLFDAVAASVGAIIGGGISFATVLRRVCSTLLWLFRICDFGHS
jgi:hypothetical protein